MNQFSLRNIEYPESLSYRSRNEFNPFLFYSQAFSNSIHLKLHLGFFSSSAINTLSLGFSKFIANGGKVQMIINQFLSHQDKDILKHGTASSPDTYPYSWNHFDEIRQSLSSFGKHFFNCVSFLISEKRIEILPVMPPEGQGIEHPKSGIFSDGENKILFTGSCNFSHNGLINNREHISLRLGWSNYFPDEIAIKEEEEEFDAIFSKKLEGIKYLTVDELITKINDAFGKENLSTLLSHEGNLIDQLRSKYFSNKKVVSYISKLESELANTHRILDLPRFPYSEIYPYQAEAFKKWQTNDFKGIFAMATGTGKTITALNCLLELYKSEGTYLCLITVPTTILVTQWYQECKKFRFQNIIQASSKHPKWIENLYSEAEYLNSGLKRDLIIISTYQTFSSDRFQRVFKKFPSSLLLICDEAHNLGSPSLKAILSNINSQRRIALSATPRRHYDPAGTSVIEKFFNDTEPYLATYSIGKAIENNFLSKYYYYPRFVTLLSEELTAYQNKTLQLMKHFDSEKQCFKDDPQVQKLLLERKRIVHKANNKKDILIDCIKELYEIRNDYRYTLVFAPEGFDVDYGDSESPIINDEYNKLTNVYVRNINSNIPNLNVEIYESITKSSQKEGIIREFETGTIPVLVSMRCLDEGVDIPRTEAAVFCSSTGNPRQYIQRRGRVLRKHPDKEFAHIFDLIVVPKIDRGSPTYNIEKSLVSSEMERLAYFAFLGME